MSDDGARVNKTASQSSSRGMSKTSDVVDQAEFGGITEADNMLNAKSADFMPKAPKSKGKQQVPMSPNTYSQLNTVDRAEEDAVVQLQPMGPMAASSTVVNLLLATGPFS